MAAVAFAEDRILRRTAASRRSAQGQAVFAIIAVTTGIGGIELDCGPAARFMAEDKLREDGPNGEKKMEQNESDGGLLP